MKNKKNNKKKIVFWTLGAVAALVLGYVLVLKFAYTLHTSNIEDKCGPILGGGIMHTVPTEPACNLRCRSQCEAQSFMYDDYSFKTAELGCNTCNCVCKTWSWE